jgi:hypothetical protein
MVGSHFFSTLLYCIVVELGWKECIKKKLGVSLTCSTPYLENNGGLTTMLEKLPNNGNVKVVVPFHVSKKRSAKP